MPRASRLTRTFDRVSEITGRPAAVAGSILLILIWAPSIALVHDQDLYQRLQTWQMPINTLTTVVTFVLVFIIQSTQNRSDKATHTKLDALIVATPGASDALVRLELADECDIDAAHDQVDPSVPPEGAP